MYITQKLKELRSLHKYSQEVLGGKLNVSRQTISNWENGRNYPDVPNLILLCDLYNISLDELIKGDVEMMRKVVEKESVSNIRKGTLKIKMTWCAIMMVLGLGCCIASLQGLSGNMLFFATGMCTGLVSMLGAALWGEQLKRKEKVKTYAEILKFYQSL